MASHQRDGTDTPLNNKAIREGAGESGHPVRIVVDAVGESRVLTPFTSRTAMARVPDPVGAGGTAGFFGLSSVTAIALTLESWIA